jgi:hypothetical protein
MKQFFVAWMRQSSDERTTLFGAVSTAASSASENHKCSEIQSEALSTQMIICVLASLADDAFKAKQGENPYDCLDSISTALQTAKMWLSFRSKTCGDNEEAGAISLREQILGDQNTSEIHQHTIETLVILSYTLKEDKSGRYNTAHRMSEELGKLLVGLTNENGFQRDIKRENIEKLITDVILELSGSRLERVNKNPRSEYPPWIQQKAARLGMSVEEMSLVDNTKVFRTKVLDLIVSPDERFCAGYRNGLSLFSNIEWNLTNGHMFGRRIPIPLDCDISTRLRDNYSFSPDSRFLAFSFCSTLYVVDCEKEKLFAHLDLPVQSISKISWTSDGNFLRLYCGNEDRSISRIWIKFDREKMVHPKETEETVNSNSSLEITPVDKSTSKIYFNWRGQKDGYSFYEYLLRNSGSATKIFTAEDMLGVVKALLDSAQQEYMSHTEIATLPDKEVQNIAVETFIGITNTISGTLYEYLQGVMEIRRNDYNAAIKATAEEINNSPQTTAMLQSTWKTLNQILELDGVAGCAAYSPAKVALTELRETLIKLSPHLEREAEAAADPLRHFSLHPGVDPEELKRRIMREAFTATKDEYRGVLLDTFRTFGWRDRLLELLNFVNW